LDQEDENIFHHFLHRNPLPMGHMFHISQVLQASHDTMLVPGILPSVMLIFRGDEFFPRVTGSVETGFARPVCVFL
jgi:hypothetical protein